jgi:alkaline phosphatase
LQQNEQKQDETLVIVTADHSHSFTITGYGKRNSSVFGDATVSIKHAQKWDKRFPGTFTKIQYAQSKAPVDQKYDQPKEATHHKDHLFSGSVSKSDVDHGADDVPVYAR